MAGENHLRVPKGTILMFNIETPRNILFNPGIIRDGCLGGNLQKYGILCLGWAESAADLEADGFRKPPDDF